MSADNKAVLEKANAAVTAGDNEGFLAYCTEDTVWTFVGEQTLHGKAAVREYMKKTYVEPPKFEVEQLVAEDDHVIAVGKISLRDAEGEMKHYAYTDVWKLRDGKLDVLKAFVIEG